MEGFIFTLIVVLIFTVGYLISQVKKYSQWKSLQQKISWCATKDSHLYRDFSLLTYLECLSKNADCNYQFPFVKKMRPINNRYILDSDEEREIAKQILDIYREDLCERFLANRLSINIAPNLKDAEYFVLSLKCFLEEHQCDFDIRGIEMHTQTIHHQDYGCWGGPLYDATYEISEFAIVYHKLLYITQEYHLAMQKDLTNEESIYHNAIQNTQNIINTKQIKITRM